MMKSFVYAVLISFSIKMLVVRVKSNLLDACLAKITDKFPRNKLKSLDFLCVLS